MDPGSTSRTIEAAARSMPLRSRLRTITFAWFLGAGWASLCGGVIFFRFADDMGLGRRSFTWGLLSAMPFVATAIQIFGSLLAEATGRNKRLFMAGLLIQRMCWLPIGLLPFFALRFPSAAVASVLLLFFVQAAGMHFSTPPWTTWMADLIPPRIRGHYFGVRHRIAMCMYLATALLSG
ncbi:MAG: hypothetical protein PHU85_01695 [Phycisphaerae bacterium]|nr:hypothetical protein [Phycisphaerae bacterium]